MDNELLMKDLKTIQNSLDVLGPDGLNRVKWFVSFGSLLYMIRDKKLGIEFNQDIDISIIGAHEFTKIKNSLMEDGFEFKRSIIHDCTGETLFADFVSPNGLSLDIFVWIKDPDKELLWHTYDEMNEKPENGIPESYYFKSTPMEYFYGKPWTLPWFEEISPFNIPFLYGTLLDCWYPNWFIPDADFGQSRCQSEMHLKTCGVLWP